MIFDHLGFTVRNLDASKAFYLKALQPLGIAVAQEGDGWVMLGKDGVGQFWLGSQGKAPGPIHFAFAAADRAAVRAFHAAALAAGGKDNGAPGIREIYHPNYYGAYAIDPDGNNVEAVCHAPEK